MRFLTTLIAVTLLTFGQANAADEYLGSWGAGSKELLKITRDGDEYSAEFFRKNVQSKYENIRFPAGLVDGVFTIKGDLGNVSAKYDASKELLMLGGVKEFKRLSSEQAALQLEKLLEKLKAEKQ